MLTQEIIAERQRIIRALMREERAGRISGEVLDRLIGIVENAPDPQLSELVRSLDELI